MRARPLRASPDLRSSAPGSSPTTSGDYKPKKNKTFWFLAQSMPLLFLRLDARSHIIAAAELDKEPAPAAPLPQIHNAAYETAALCRHHFRRPLTFIGTSFSSSSGSMIKRDGGRCKVKVRCPFSRPPSKVQGNNGLSTSSYDPSQNLQSAPKFVWKKPKSLLSTKPSRL